MRKFMLGIVLAVAFMMLPSEASAQACDVPQGGIVSHYTNYNIWRVSNTVEKGVCDAATAETWFTAGGGWACNLGEMSEGRCVDTNFGGPATSQITYYGCGTVQARGQGHWKYPWGNVWMQSEVWVSNYTISCPTPPSYEVLGCSYEQTIEWDYVGEHWYCASPILINLKKNQPYRLTSVADGVLFDLNADGIVDRVAWTYADDDVAWLAIDRNGNGTIDNGTELFGSFTNEAHNGFEALSNMQLAERGARRSIVDADDAVYHRLLLWTDRNHDGISQSKELEPFSKQFSGVQMAYQVNTASDRTDANGNTYYYRGEVVKRTEAGKNPLDFFNKDLSARTTVVYDVWLRFTTGN